MELNLVNSLLVDLEKTCSSCPERQLLSAILLRTWADLDSINKFIRNTSYYWLDLTETEDWSFPWICEALNLNPRVVKKSMLSYPYYEQVQKLGPERYGKSKKTALCYFD
jgi:hypothetical protein